MQPSIRLHRLTEDVIHRAMEGSLHENEIASFETEEDLVVDENSDSEIDYESPYEIESDDADNNEEEEIEIETAESDKFIGRDETEWQKTPFLATRLSRSVNRHTLNKVNLIGGQRINTADDAFGYFFTTAVVDMLVKFTNMEANRLKSDWKNVDAIEIRAFIGLLITAGIERASKRNYVEFYDPLRRPANISSNYGFETFYRDSSIHSF